MIARIMFVANLFGMTLAVAVALSLRQSGADAFAWQGWAVSAALMAVRALQWGDKA